MIQRMTRLLWLLRAFLWGMCHPLAGWQAHYDRAVWAARKEMRRGR